MKSFKELKVWQKGIELVAIVYKITASFPEEEKYGLSSKIEELSKMLFSCEEVLELKGIISVNLNYAWIICFYLRLAFLHLAFASHI